MSELIEKQKVLDALREIATEKFSLDDPYGVYINVLMDVEEKICRLPVVQPNGPDNLVKDSQGLAKELVNDTISRQAAIEALEKIDCSDGVGISSLKCDAVDDAVTAIKVLPSAQPEQRWIPCSERLPENGRQVLVYARSVHYALAKYDEMREADGTYKKQWVTFDAWKPYYTIKEVIAWMPLPEPWKGEEDG